jgi:hypothetical protein
MQAKRTRKESNSLESWQLLADEDTVQSLLEPDENDEFHAAKEWQLEMKKMKMGNCLCQFVGILILMGMLNLGRRIFNHDANLLLTSGLQANLSDARAHTDKDAFTNMLLSERNGIASLCDRQEGLFAKVKFKGKGHEASDLRLLIGKYEEWCQKLCPVCTR